MLDQQRDYVLRTVEDGHSLREATVNHPEAALGQVPGGGVADVHVVSLG